MEDPGPRSRSGLQAGWELRCLNFKSYPLSIARCFLTEITGSVHVALKPLQVENLPNFQGLREGRFKVPTKGSLPPALLPRAPGKAQADVSVWTLPPPPVVECSPPPPRSDSFLQIRKPSFGAQTMQPHTFLDTQQGLCIQCFLIQRWEQGQPWAGCCHEPPRPPSGIEDSLP